MLPQRVYAEVNLDAICQNIQNAMKKVGPDTKIMAIIKTDAYGHGAVPIARALSEIGCYAFGVATVPEAVQLRKAGIENPILILGYVFPADYDALIENNIMHAVFQYETAKALSDKAVSLGKTVTIHIKLDTGMGRIGMQPTEESVQEIQRIAALPNLEINGIFTHFASADLADEESLAYTKKQYEMFTAFCRRLEEEGVHIRVRHCCSSAGLLEYPEFHLEMVRPGIVQYGYDPSEEMPSRLFVPKPVMSLHCCVTCVKVIEPGETISYGRCFKAERPTKIATLPVGYADGYSRLLSNRVDVLIHGRRAPQVGNVCMDQCMVDVTDVPDVAVGDEVVLFGRQGTEEIRLGELAKILGTIDHEVLCNINRRVPRVYVKGGKIVKRVEYLFP